LKKSPSEILRDEAFFFIVRIAFKNRDIFADLKNANIPWYKSSPPKNLN
jgi:hypothetical protein